MIKLNNYISEAWSGVKQHTNIENIKAWCKEMDIKNYTINSQGEIDVDGDVWIFQENIKELPYKFGTVNGFFDMEFCGNLISLKNSPNYVGGYFSCYHCSKLFSLEGCPAKVGGSFLANRCKREFTKEEVLSLCKVKNTNIRV